jgi:allantoicase
MYSYEKKTPAPAYTKLPDLASASVGGQVLFATDEWFAAADNIVNPESPVFDPAAFNDFGKVMDGWETRRKRQAGHDWCVIRLGLPGALQGFTFDTAFFTGNQTLRVSVQGACLDEDPESLRELRGEGVSGIGTCASADAMAKVANAKTEEWKELVTMTPLRPGYDATRLNYAPVVGDMRNEKITHIRLNYYPDGGVARMYAHGKVLVDPASLPAKLDLAAAKYGGVALSCRWVSFTDDVMFSLII